MGGKLSILISQQRAAYFSPTCKDKEMRRPIKGKADRAQRCKPRLVRLSEIQVVFKIYKKAVSDEYLR